MNLPDNSIHLQLPRPVCEAIIRPVPEHRADQELSEIYRDLKATFGVPWVGVITQAVAYYRPFFAEAWRRFAPSAKTHFFERASDDIRIRSWELMGQSFVIEGQTDRLREMGYSVREIGQIRAVLDIFDYGNPKYLIFATAIKEGLLSGRTFGGAAGDARCHFPRSPICQIDPIPVMVEEHHAGGTLSQVYADIKQTLQLPFINSDYKAMARWPSYLEQAWGALKPCIDTPAYQAGRFDINARALAALDALPTAYRMSRDDALQAGLSEAQTDELIQVISLFQWMLSGIVLNVTHFKQQALKLEHHHHHH
uniref:(R)-2-haloacid dehalogenase n=1 Tax=Pseudomonas putida TaxID=303 RepID=UPI000BBD49A9|nr:Chain A, (R)-2-haloacid dehalogenase [Pseudomonas putida]5H01_B Chain B, (R)-2-haloacid dehalogenase [Pseudomonas putida]5H01_C Chain C, (R)-2-haloacid dehalogenase [Pseudomonas putida]5H01_D Chain D, (R)-2-haloacid dehalogenase [Pseudomonas putida]